MSRFNLLILVGCFYVWLCTGCTDSNWDIGSCSVSKSVNETYIQCPDGTNATITDGKDGVNGTVIETIDPCGKQTSHDEILLVMSSGQVLAFFTQGSVYGSRLTLLNEGVTYQTTDGTNCKFKIENGNVLDNL